MRLACPNCGAEYEVPEGLVPEGGKHVQCTDCDTRWFVRGGRDAVVSEDQLIERLENWRPRLVSGGAPPANPVAEAVKPSPPQERRPFEPETARAPEPEPEPAPEPAAPPMGVWDEHDPDRDPDRDVMPDLDYDGPPEDFVWEDSDGVARPPDPAPDARALARPTPSPPSPAPPAAAPMFRPVPTPEARTAPVPAPEDRKTPVTRTDAGSAGALGADAGDEDARPVRERTRSSHRIVLPEDGAWPADVAEPPGESRFRTGMLVALALFALALGSYAGREAIVDTVPAAGPALDGYAGAVDDLRERIDAIIAPDG
jgi:predicted Zn finger-like uncharacterized protein